MSAITQMDVLISGTQKWFHDVTCNRYVTGKSVCNQVTLLVTSHFWKHVKNEHFQHGDVWRSPILNLCSPNGLWPRQSIHRPHGRSRFRWGSRSSYQSIDGKVYGKPWCQPWIWKGFLSFLHVFSNISGIDRGMPAGCAVWANDL